MSKITVKELKQLIKELDDNTVLQIFAVNAPPHITDYAMRVLEVVEDE
tara:strand:- start:538 stop:681 length:144 start_codon:yes stop_codon:yes gene_type:complete